MSIVIHLAKEFIAYCLFQLQSLLHRKKTEDEQIIINIKQNGYHVLNDFLSAEQCQILSEEFKTIISDPKNKEAIWIDKEGSDTRLYFAEKFSTLFRGKLSDVYLHQIKDDYLGKNISQFREDMMLVNRLLPKKNNLGSGGGWHRDSRYYKQFKAIIYLTDVSEKNGPFQFLKGSHNIKNTLQLFFRKFTKAGQYRFSEIEADAIIESRGKEKLQTFTGTKGTCILVDTRGFHRGMPIQEGERVAMTYYFNGAVEDD